MREIVLDTETTGLDHQNGDRIVEIGAIELINHVPTGRSDGIFHRYINPDCAMSPEAAAVHGLTDAFLADKPVFAEIVGAFLEFIGDAPLVIHNAPFDMGFLNAELRRIGAPPLPMTRAVDTVALARQMFPGAQASLDALCRRYGIDNTGRTLHGALLDAQLLAEVYLELRGGRQPGLVLIGQPGAALAAGAAGPAAPRRRREPRPHAPAADELAAHEAFLEKLSQPIWRM